jgi:YgiT-type zinc finger domain-containing protein
MSQQCSFCGHAHLKATLTLYIHQRGDDLLIVDDVPCLECEFCGEQYFPIETLKTIEADHVALSAGAKRPARTLAVAVERFGAL